MVDDRELWACAILLIGQHGEGARKSAVGRVEALRAAGEMEGARTFERIADRILQLEQVECDCALNQELAAMPRGTRRRLTGLLQNSARGPILEVDGGGVYALDLDRPVPELIGQRVTVEGVRSGFDRLDVDYLGPA